MRPALRLPPVLVLALGLAGCGDMAYQTRYIPVSAESVFSPAEQLTWSGDKEVYELPANPPAVDGVYDGTLDPTYDPMAHTGEDAVAEREKYTLYRRSRVDCKPPGQKFKPQAVVGIQDTQRHPETNEPALVGALNSDPEPGLPFKPQKDVPVAAWQDPDPRGAREQIGLVPVAASERGPFPFRGSGTETIPPIPVAAYRSDQVDWCTSHPGSLTPTP